MSKIVERTLDFLELFAREKRPLSLSDISRLLTIPVSSCHDVLQALQDRGFLYEISPRGGYYPTLRFYDMGKIIAEHDPVLLRAENLLRELRDTLDETVLLAKVSGLRGTYLLAFETSKPLRIQLRVGDSVTSLHGASAGNTILGNLCDAALDATLETLELKRFTPKTITDKHVLRAKILKSREVGYYVNDNESIDGLMTISAPFIWQHSLYIVTVAAPSSRLEQRIEPVAELLLAVCRKLEMKVGK
jgi:DNA-binding IclR family transcriptional regulator